jgi:SRSO17 transposase
LVNATRATIINAKLFLPKSWTEDKKRCDKADVPKESRKFQTKPQLALSMIDEDIANGVKFDWIDGDGLYGHNFDLTSGLDERKLFFVLDVHKDERIYLQEPEIKIPPKKGAKGRPPFRLQPEGDPMRLDKYKDGLNQDIDRRVRYQEIEEILLES